MPAPPNLGLRHVALRFSDLAAAERFFVDVLGYEVEWRPDPENVYLRGSGDNVALHRAERPASAASAEGLLDHIGILVARPGDVDAWAEWLAAAGARLLAAPRTHRDGARSLYVSGPEELVVQVIHHPPLAPPG
ncbi:MAG TPA: VOC family protein [Anaeromyxobacteraceae bacterium]|jgi:catechol 2,3-dioxygenase-like lactoylglutathione lyase family enzyme|nr:VOC family protein [Anaeromyxobacteraceae bacterium]